MPLRRLLSMFLRLWGIDQQSLSCLAMVKRHLSIITARWSMTKMRRSQSVGKYEIDTPALLVDLDAMEKNISKMASFFSKVRARLRPHAKTHKTPAIAHKQLHADAVGITCQKLGEAEVMAEAGIKNILISNEIAGEQKMWRLTNLAKQNGIIVAVDSVENANHLSSVALRRGMKLDVLVEVDVGMNRCGVQPGKQALSLARRILRCGGLEFRGLMGYEGHAVFIEEYSKREMECKKAMNLLIATRDMLEDARIDVQIVSAGGTGTYKIAGKFPGVTEVQAGSYVLMDARYKKVVPEFDCALALLCTVISKPTRDRAVVDAGMKSISQEFGIPAIKGIDGVEVVRLSEEHGVLNVKNSSQEISVGDRLEMIPTHVCTTVNLHDRLYGVRDNELEVIWNIAARGKSQ